MSHARPLLLLTLIALLTIVPACARDTGSQERGPASPDQAGGARGAARPPQYDLNGDGKVTRQEFMAVRGLCFARYDGNGDGRLTRPEVQHLVPARLAERVETAFSRMDLDRDGEISRQEFDQESDRLFRMLDTNGDGVIAGMELAGATQVLAGDLCQLSGSSASGGETRSGEGRGSRRGRY